ncbi:DNA ligase [Mycena sanguinolenta]|uniref:DNA ligase n=1 Tax=Mycena sanguinolenta TaxID=230812 RepID=A0A8H6Z4Q1_9AGAR|nr:DNA ligase [Mycena sanguinolenta]
MPTESQEASPQGVPFSFFVSLLREISVHSRPKKTGSKHDKHSASYPALITLNNWIKTLRAKFAPLPPNTTAIVFRLLFPEEDTRRKYDMQETRLAAALADCFGTSATPLRQWAAEASSGCLGQEVLKFLNKTSSYPADYISPLSISEVDNLLEELAAHSGYSDVSVRSIATRRSKTTILRTLYRSLSALDASFLTQIILKDLRPLLYPLSEAHYTVALKSFNSVSVTELSKEDAMKAWDPTGQMLRNYRVRCGLDDAAAAFDTGIVGTIAPRIGIPIAIPKSEKGRGCLHALEILQASTEIWAETKYDGERAQIHVQIFDNGRSRITIFSKSKRDSTMDRYGVHSVIREALGLPEEAGLGFSSSKVKKEVILDAEMVAWQADKIDEFWRIHALVAHTARGIRNQPQDDVPHDNYSQASLMTDISDDRHLGLVFFDILMLDSKSLLSVPYSSRRAILESVIQPLPNRAILADRTRIALNLTPSDNVPMLHHVFAQCLARPEEGLVLKAAEASYNDMRFPWVKLKRDYIPGYGDCIDLVILGGSWDKNRARELRVAPNAYTTFYIGGLHNADQLRKDPSARPHFHIYFTASYGLSREELEGTNFLIKSSDAIPYDPSHAPSDLPFTFTVFPGLVPPAVILREPLLAELFGAGFTKSPRNRHYELRFPRITKIFRTGERSWQDGMNLQELHKVARDTVGRDRSNKDIDDWNNDLWGKPVSPGVSLKRKAKADIWEEKLIADDRMRARKRGWTAFDSRVLPAAPRIRSSPRPLTTRTNLRESRGPSSRKTPQAPNPSTPSLRYKTRLPSVYPSPISSPLAAQRTIQLPISTKDRESISDVLSDSLVFVAAQNPTSRQLWKLKIPPERTVHSLEALFIACGWDSPGPPSPWIQRGIIVLDVDESTAHRTNILDAMNKRKAACVEQQFKRKAICMLEGNMLR